MRLRDKEKLKGKEIPLNLFCLSRLNWFDVWCLIMLKVNEPYSFLTLVFSEKGMLIQIFSITLGSCFIFDVFVLHSFRKPEVNGSSFLLWNETVKQNFSMHPCSDRELLVFATMSSLFQSCFMHVSLLSAKSPEINWYTD